MPAVRSIGLDSDADKLPLSLRSHKFVRSDSASGMAFTCKDGPHVDHARVGDADSMPVWFVSGGPPPRRSLKITPRCPSTLASLLPAIHSIGSRSITATGYPKSFTKQEALSPLVEFLPATYLDFWNLEPWKRYRSAGSVWKVSNTPSRRVRLRGTP
jgi:hypothetical protein